MDLVILAAGMGSRFGGLKQISPIDDNGDFIIDYSIFDAVRVGFDRVVFIIKKENFELFDSTIGKRIKPYVEVEYAFQDFNSFLPERFKSIKREKPWGTAHAILCAKDKVRGDFAVINADDFYGKKSFEEICNFLKTVKSEKDNAMVVYKLANTTSKNGEVTRGICKVFDKCLSGVEDMVIRPEGEKLYCRALGTVGNEKEIDKDTLVSVNLFGFNNNIFGYLEKGFYEFLEKNEGNLQTKEYFIPTILTELIDSGICNIKILESDEKWFGLTYKNDYYDIYDGIKLLRDNRVYPEILWKK